MEGRRKDPKERRVRLCLTIRGEERDETIGEDKGKRKKRKRKGEKKREKKRKNRLIDPKI